ncbi:uncharacterized protein LOC130181755 [Seriola aureovittata]|uniref:uncharacterized protein LOC130181755 n=1 Tax=Seriola aureovittata TaxID=2871759 RepID=UPI0024BE3418|nr:uncharacterized protein LOC130181755 [Seriola aureovittata]
MAVWFPTSQLLLIALLSWNVHCFPAKKGWSQPNLYEGSFSNQDIPAGLHYRSSQAAPIQPSYVNQPALSFRHEPVDEKMYSSPQTYPASSGPTTLSSSEASWNVAPAWDPVEESTTARGVSQPRPDIGLPPPPPFYQAGELERYEENFEHGNTERETEELNFVPPPPPYAAPDYKSISNHGTGEGKPGLGLMGLPPFELKSLPNSDSHLQPVPVGPSQYYLFLTGQLPPGTYTNYQADYETGRNYWDEDHYERYHFPDAQSPVISTQTQEVPSYRSRKTLKS